MHPILKSDNFYMVFINVAKKSVDMIDIRLVQEGVVLGAKYDGIQQLIVSWL